MYSTLMSFLPKRGTASHQPISDVLEEKGEEKATGVAGTSILTQNPIHTSHNSDDEAPDSSFENDGNESGAVLSTDQISYQERKDADVHLSTAIPLSSSSFSPLPSSHSLSYTHTSTLSSISSLEGPEYQSFGSTPPTPPNEKLSCLVLKYVSR